jgi:hypothetical protein
MTPYVPPKGMTDLVRVLQHCSADDAARVLVLAFQDCACDAILQDRLRFAAYDLLAACKAALETADTGRALDWHRLTAAIEQAERTEPVKEPPCTVF